MIRGANRVLRGGSWNNNGRNCRSANRNRNTPDNHWNNTGFRLALAHALKDTLFDPTFILSVSVELAAKSTALRYASRNLSERLPERRS